MRDYNEYHQILELWERGIAKKRIAITLGIPRATVRDCIERYSDLKGLQENRCRSPLRVFAEFLLNLIHP